MPRWSESFGDVERGECLPFLTRENRNRRRQFIILKVTRYLCALNHMLEVEGEMKTVG